MGAGLLFYDDKHAKANARSIPETSYLSVDIGGVFLHSSGYEISEGKVHLILSPKSVTLAEGMINFLEHLFLSQLHWKG
jgi:hypothetical protein